MIITSKTSFTAEQLKDLREQFDIYIKTVIDIDSKICVAGMDRHFEGEEILLKQGSSQSSLWGGGIDLESRTVDFNSFINIRPNHNNTSNEIQDKIIRQRYEELSKYFFKEIYDK